MALIEHTMFGVINKVDTAIQRIRLYDPLQYSDDPYYVAYSGGKDSDTIRILCQLAGIEHDLAHNHTTLDAPETVRYVRSIPGVQIKYPDITGWDLIVRKLIPPTRRSRYCCQELKERGGADRVTMTGVRWAESEKRKKNRGSAEIMGATPKSNIVLNADNDDNRRVFEHCMTRRKRILNPIVDWSDEDVWEFLEYYGCASNPLYQCGFTRVGCVGCPLAGRKRYKEWQRWPEYKAQYIRTFDRMLAERERRGRTTAWQSGEEVFAWWMNDKRRKYTIPEEQIAMIILPEIMALKG